MTDCLLAAGLFPHRRVLRVLGRPALRNTADNRLGGRGQPQEGGVGEQRGGRGAGDRRQHGVEWEDSFNLCVGREIDSFYNKELIVLYYF